MTDREKAVITAHTGITMLAGEKFSIFHKYIEDLLGRPVWTHEFADELVWNEIKEKSKDDFIEICKTDDKPTGEWIPVSERLPNLYEVVLVTDEIGTVFEYERRPLDEEGNVCEKWSFLGRNITAWMPLPEAYKEGGADMRGGKE